VSDSHADYGADEAAEIKRIASTDPQAEREDDAPTVEGPERMFVIATFPLRFHAKSSRELDLAVARMREEPLTMVITFLALSAKRPIGGVTAVYGFANRLSRRGHEVHMVHVDFLGDASEPVCELPDPIEAVEDITWFSFDQEIRHHVVERYDEEELPESDFIFYYGGKVPEQSGLPLIFIDSYKIHSEDYERSLCLERCPKVCVASWLVDVALDFGAPANQLVHVPYGLDHEKYRLVSPIEERPSQVSMCYQDHPAKAPIFGLKALAEVKRRLPGLRVVVFGAAASVEPMPPWVTYLKSPDQDVLVNEIYNGSRVFFNSSTFEGFGLPPIEAMACGSALVTTDNGGSRDYANHGETALVADPKDIAAWVDHIETLLVDDEYRIRLAARGKEYVKRFDWDRSAELLEAFLEKYAADPARYQQSALAPF
jgi:glycosyltransferase involved in cell wall biosynthesis